MALESAVRCLQGKERDAATGKGRPRPASRLELYTAVALGARRGECVTMMGTGDQVWPWTNSGGVACLDERLV